MPSTVCPSCDTFQSFKNELGRLRWGELHGKAHIFPDYPTDEQRATAREDFHKLIFEFPCPPCVAHSKHYLDERPLDFTNRETLERGVCEFHNSVNEKTGKAIHPCNVSPTPPIPDKPFNIPDALNNSRMASDIVTITGSQLAAKGTEKVLPALDRALNLRGPLNLKTVGTPLIGAALLIYAWKQPQAGDKQLALVSYAAHLLSQGVDTVQEVLLPGSAQGLSIRAIPGQNVNQFSGFGRRAPIF